jgi:hypothetical protein
MGRSVTTVRGDLGMTVRLRVARLLGAADLEPRGLPPSAVLLVRRMDDPLPSRFVPDKFAARVTPEWEGATRNAIENHYRRAARPANESVSESAEAVLFSDGAEMLACLARDLCRGTATRFWWWRTKLRVRPFSLRKRFGYVDTMLATWQADIRYLPAMLTLLVSWNQAENVLRALSPAEAWQTLWYLAREYGVSIPSSFATATIPVQSGTHLQTESAMRTPTGNQSARGELYPPWEPLIPGTLFPKSLSREQLSLLGVALILHKAPQVASNPAFAARFVQWFTSAQTASSDISEPRLPSGETYLSSQLSSQDAGTALPGKSTVEPARPLPNQTAALARFTDSLAGEVEGFNIAGGSAGVLRSDLPDEARSLGSAQPQAGAWSNVEETCFNTELGGVLFLLNVLHALDLPKALVFHFGISNPPGAWALLELLARCLLADVFPSVANDPIWLALASLDGRCPDVVPGNEFSAPRTYVAPESWLKDCEADRGFVRFRAHGVEVWHPEGFVWVDSDELPRSIPVARLPKLLWRRFRRAAAVRLAGFTPSPQLRRFLRFLLSYVRWRLAQAMPQVRPEEVLHRRGRLYISPAHVDLVLDLNQIHLPARLAGLDANPGWRPELDRVVKFHFVEAERFHGV